MATHLYLLDTEATSRSPFSGVMTEFAVIDFATLAWFHGVLYQSMPHPENPGLPVLTGTGGPTYAHGDATQSVHDTPPTPAADRTEVMSRFSDWINTMGRGAMYSDNPTFDGAWMNYHFDEAGLPNPLGFSGHRIGNLAAGLKGKWRDTNSWKRYRRTKHTHHPVDDALGNAEALREILTRHNQQF